MRRVRVEVVDEHNIIIIHDNAFPQEIRVKRPAANDTESTAVEPRVVRSCPRDGADTIQYETDRFSGRALI